MTSEKLAQKFHTGGVLPRKSGSCFWVVVNLLHPIRSNSQMWVVARHHSLWDFCAHSADVILLENQWLRHENVGYFFRSWGSNRKVIAKIATGCRLCHFVAQYFCGERKTLKFSKKTFEHLIIIWWWNGIRGTVIDTQSKCLKIITPNWRWCVLLSSAVARGNSEVLMEVITLGGGVRIT